MKINDIFRIIEVCIIILIGFTIFTGKILIGLILATSTFLIIYPLKKKQIKHDIEIETKYNMEAIDKYNNKNNFCSNCGNKINEKDNFCSNCKNKLMK